MGLASPRAGARQGYLLALTEAMQRFACVRFFTVASLAAKLKVLAYSLQAYTGAHPRPEP